MTFKNKLCYDNIKPFRQRKEKEESYAKNLLWSYFNFNLSFNNHVISLLPDFIGWLLIAKGCQELLPYGIHVLDTAKKMASLNFLLTAIIFVIRLLGLGLSLGVLGGLYTSTIQILGLLTIYYIIQGCKYLEVKDQQDYQGEKMFSLWKTIVLLTALNVVLLLLLPGLAVISAIVSMVIYTLLLVTFYRTAKLFQQVHNQL